MDNQITIDATEYRLLVEAQVRLNVVSNLEIEERYLSTDTILHILGLHTKEEVEEFTKTMQNGTAANLRRRIDELKQSLDSLTGDGKALAGASGSAVEVTA